jgi:hypothetical protein
MNDEGLKRRRGLLLLAQTAIIERDNWSPG